MVDFRQQTVRRRDFDSIFVFSVKNYPDLAFGLSKFEPVGQRYDFFKFLYSGLSLAILACFVGRL